MFKRRHPADGHAPVQPSEPGIKETLGPEMTVVGRGAQVEGTLISTESIRIDGQVKGRIAARCDVILSSHSDVEADIRHSLERVAVVVGAQGIASPVPERPSGEVRVHVDR